MHGGKQGSTQDNLLRKTSREKRSSRGRLGSLQIRKKGDREGESPNNP